MAVSQIFKHDQDGVISLADGTGTPVTLTVPFTNGDFSLSGLGRTHAELVKYQTRGGKGECFRYGAKTYPTGSFTAVLTELSAAATDIVLLDFVRKTGTCASNVSTLGTSTNVVYTIDITLTIEGTDNGDAADHTIVLTDCHCTADLTEGTPDSVTINFEVLGTVTMT